MLVFSTPQRGATCSRARNLNAQDTLQTIGVVGAKDLLYMNATARKERVPLPWQNFLG